MGASLTSIFKADGVAPNSIIAAAQRYPLAMVDGKKRVTAMDSDEMAAYHRFLSFIQLSDLGVKLAGIRITNYFVLSSLSKICILVPLIRIVLAEMVAAHRIFFNNT